MTRRAWLDSKTIGSIGLALFGTLAARADENSPEWRELVSPGGSAEIGVGFVTGGTPIFSTATGIDPDGPYLFGNLDLHGGAPYDAAEPSRWRLHGTRLGLENAELRGEYFEQGRYGIRLALDQLTRDAAENYRTPFLGLGTVNLTLPDGLAQAAANPQAGAATLENAMRPFGIGTTRRRTNFSGNYRLSPDWEFRATLSEDRVTGTRATGATLGTGGNSIAMILPEPVDTITRRIEASVGYQHPGRHLLLTYQGSFFTNDIDGYSFQSPFAIPNTLLDNRMGSAPDNQAQRIGLDGGYTFGPKARLTASAAYGRLTQNDAFLPYSTAADAPALPRADLDGEVVTRQFQVKFASRPRQDLRINASYKYDSRDNRTPIDTYILPGVSSARLGEVGGANFSVGNTPYSRDIRLGQIEAGYTPRPGDDLTVSARHEEIARFCHGDPECVEVPETREDAWRLEWRREFAPGVSGRLGLGEAERRGDDYQRYAESVELAGMRKFFLADRRRARLHAGLNAEISDALSLGVTLEANRDRYDRSPYGLRSADNRAVMVDLGYVVDSDLSLALFAGRETYRSLLSGSYSATLAEPGVTAEIPGAQWQARMEDRVDTLGMSFKHKGLKSGQLEIEGDLALVRANSPYRILGGPGSASATVALPPEPLPAVNSLCIEARLTARYVLDARATLRLAYLYRHLTGDDFALDLYGIATLSRLLGTDETTPRHEAHALSIGYEYRFR